MNHDEDGERGCERRPPKPFEHERRSAKHEKLQDEPRNSRNLDQAATPATRVVGNGEGAPKDRGE